MRQRGSWVVLAAVLTGMLAARGTAKEQRSSAKEGYLQLIAVTTPDGNAAHPEAWPEALVAHRHWSGTPEQVEAWRREGVARLTPMKILRVEEVDDDAFVSVRGAAGEAVVPLRWRSDHWELAAPLEWLVKGDALDAANGEEAASVKLIARTTNGPYGKSAFSFAHVTQDPEHCLNRMDVWYYHNGDLHVIGDGAIIDVGRKRRSRLGDLPLSRKAWVQTARAEKGHVYVLHVHRDGLFQRYR